MLSLFAAPKMFSSARKRDVISLILWRERNFIFSHGLYTFKTLSAMLLSSDPNSVCHIKPQFIVLTALIPTVKFITSTKLCGRCLLYLDGMNT